MMRTGHFGLFVANMVLAALVVSPVSPALAQAELPTDVKAALQQNAEAMKGLQIEGYQERRFLVNAKQGLAQIGRSSKQEFTQRVEFILKLQGERFYESLHYPPGEFRDRATVDERSFDGVKYFSGSADPSDDINPGILIIHNSETKQAVSAREGQRPQIFEFWYLPASGFDGPIRTENLGTPIRSLVLARIDEGELVSAGPVSRDGEELYEVVVKYPDPWTTPPPEQEREPGVQPYKPETMERLKKLAEDQRRLAGTTRQCRFLLDPKRNYCMRELSEWRDEGAVMFHTVCSRFMQVDGTQLWLPRESNIVSSAYELRPRDVAKQPIYETIIRMEKVTQEQFSDDQFQIWYDYPGVSVADYTHAKAADGRAFQYMIPASAESLADPAGEHRPWLLIANIVLVIVVLGAVVWRRQRLHK